MDPFSITASTIGLISSLTSLSLKLNELRQDFVEAKSEIEAILREFADLTNVLTRLQNSGKVSNLPTSLSKDISSVLSNCNTVAVEAEILLRRAAAKRMRGAYWAFTGKKECLQLCRGMEAHKATINITLNLCSVEASNEILQRTDQILFEIQIARQQVTPSNMILDRYLNDMESYAETIYEQSTIVDTEDASMSVVSDPPGSAATERPTMMASPPQSSQREGQSTTDEQSHHYTIDHNTQPTATEVQKASLASKSPTLPQGRRTSLIATFWKKKPNDAETVNHKSSARQPIIEQAAAKRPHLLALFPERHSCKVECIAFSPDGRVLASADGDGTLKLWDVVENSLLQTILHCSSKMTALAFSPTMDFLLLSGKYSGPNRSLKPLNSGNMYYIRGLLKNGSDVKHMLFSTDGYRIVASNKGYIGVFNFISVDDIKQMCYIEVNDSVSAIALTDNATKVAAYTDSHVAKCWDIKTRQLLSQITFNSTLNGQIRMSFSALTTERVILTNGYSMFVWNTSSRSVAQTRLQGVGSLLLTFRRPDDKIITYGAARRGKITAYNSQTGTKSESDYLAGDYLSCLAGHSMNNFLASGGHDGTVALWQLPAEFSV